MPYTPDNRQTGKRQLPAVDKRRVAGIGADMAGGTLPDRFGKRERLPEIAVLIDLLRERQPNPPRPIQAITHTAPHVQNPGVSRRITMRPGSGHLSINTSSMAVMSDTSAGSLRSGAR